MQVISKKAVDSLIRAQKHGWYIQSIYQGGRNRVGSIVMLLKRRGVLVGILIGFNGKWAKGCSKAKLP